MKQFKSGWKESFERWKRLKRNSIYQNERGLGNTGILLLNDLLEQAFLGGMAFAHEEEIERELVNP